MVLNQIAEAEDALAHTSRSARAFKEEIAHEGFSAAIRNRDRID
jgi:hypothetical protein